MNIRKGIDRLSIAFFICLNIFFIFMTWLDNNISEIFIWLGFDAIIVLLYLLLRFLVIWIIKGFKDDNP